jgi:hypothetical protein
VVKDTLYLICIFTVEDMMVFFTDLLDDSEATFADAVYDTCFVNSMLCFSLCGVFGYR